MKKILIVLEVILIFISANLFAQKSFSKGKLVKERSGFFIESIVKPYSKDSVDVTFLFRIDNSRLRFSQELITESKQEVLVAYPNIEIEIKDSEGIIRKRLPWEQKSTMLIGAKTNNSLTFGVLSSRLKKDNYEAKFILRDKTTFLQKKKISIDAKVDDNIVSNIPIFAQQFENSPNTYSPIISNGNIQFEAKNVKAFFYAKNMDGWKFSINSIEEKNYPTMWEKELSLEGDVNYVNYPPDFIIGGENKENQIRYSIDSKEHDYKIYSLNIPALSIRPQHYQLHCFSPAGDTISYEYEVVWETQPESLYDMDYATEIMYYILDDDAYSKMNSGNDEDKMKKLLAYWKTQDNTPETPYIEAMTEYFRRADYSKNEYSTVRHKDGAYTPRGQICILYGIPDHIEDTIADEKVLEIWKYDALNMTFTFEVPKPGEYVLMKID